MRNFLTALGLLALSSVGSVAQAGPHGGYSNNFGGYQYSNSPGFGVGFGMGDMTTSAGTVNRCEGIAWHGGCTDTNEFNYLVVKTMRSLGVCGLENQARV